MTTAAPFWDKIAEKYAAKPVKNAAAFERKQAITREHLRPESKVVEIGCGTGSLALDLSPFAGHIHAVDISAEMLRIANEKKQARGVANVTFHQGTLDGPDTFQPGSFDLALAYSILHLVPDRLHVLRSLWGLLKPGGSFISSNVCLGDTWLPYGPLISVARWLGKAPVVHSYDRETIVREMRAVGFAHIQPRDVGTEKTIAFIIARKPE